MYKTLIELNKKYTSIVKNVEYQKENFVKEQKKSEEKLTPSKEDKEQINKLIKLMSDAISENFPEISSTENEITSQKQQEINEFLIDNGFIEEIEADIDNIVDEDVINAIQSHDHLNRQINYLMNNSIVNLISEFENYSIEMFKSYFIDNPEEVVENKNISIVDLKKLNNLNEAYELLINKEIINQMYKKAETWISLYKSKLKLDIQYFVNNRNKFNEYFLRRNLIIHNNGIVNNIYLSSLEDNIYHYKLGDKVKSDERYINEMRDKLLTFASILLIDLWNKSNNIKSITKDEKNVDIEDIDGNISSIAFKLLSESKWKESIEIYKKLHASKHIGQSNKHMYYLNILLCKKKLNHSGIKDEISNLDYSAYADFLKMGAIALKEDVESLINLINRKNQEINLTKKQFLEWPIFEDIRKNNDNKKMIIEVLDKNKPKVVNYKINLNKIKELTE